MIPVSYTHLDVYKRQVQASDTLPELTKDNALEQMMKAGETDSLVSNHKSYEATCEYILQNTKVYDYEDSEVMYVDMYGTTQMLYKDGELKYGKEGDEYLSCLYIDCLLYTSRCV